MTVECSKLNYRGSGSAADDTIPRNPLTDVHRGTDPKSAGTLSKDDELGRVTSTARDVRKHELGNRQSHVIAPRQRCRDEKFPALVLPAAHAGEADGCAGRYFEKALEGP